MATALALTLILATAQEPAATQIYKTSLPSVTTITIWDANEKVSFGTGFLAIKDGVAVTAWHVVKGARRAVARFSSGEEFTISGLIDKDERRDVALVRIKVADRPLLPFASSAPEVGAKAYVIGAPKGLEFSISDGLLSQIQQIDGVNQYQFTCPASTGNSGGPLLNAKGEVLGLVSWQIREGQNLNFAIPYSYIKGLDASLPTTPWADVKLESPEPTATEDGEEEEEPPKVFDAVRYAKAVEAALWARATARIAFLYVSSNVITKAGGFKKGAPYEAFSALTALENSEKTLVLTVPGNKKDLAVLEQLLAQISKLREALSLQKGAIGAAQLEGGWTPPAADEWKAAVAVMDSFFDMDGAELNALLNDEKFLATLPIELRNALSAHKPDGTGFLLGGSAWPRQPTRFASLDKEGFGTKLGFRIDDVVIECDGRPVKGLPEVKGIIKENLGRKIKVRIWRDGKEREIELKIPKEIPREAIDRRQ